MNRILSPTLSALAFLLAAACSGDDGGAHSGISTATGAPRSTATIEATSTATPARTAAPVRTVLPSTAEATEIEIALAGLAGEDPSHIAGAMEELLDRCTEDRAAIGASTERVWRILNEDRDMNVPILAILTRVISSFPIDGRSVGCESLLASVVTEMSR